MEVGGENHVGKLHTELSSLKRSVNRSHCVVAALLIAIVVLFVSFVAIAVSQGKAIESLKAREGLLPNPNVTFATRAGDRNVDDLTYGGSLFRGSGFWAPKKSLPGIYIYIYIYIYAICIYTHTHIL